MNDKTSKLALPVLGKPVPSLAYLLYAVLLFSLFAGYSFMNFQVGGSFSFIGSLSFALWPLYLVVLPPYTFGPFLLAGFAAPFFKGSSLTVFGCRISLTHISLAFILLDIIFVKVFRDPETVNWEISFHIAATLWIFAWWGVVALSRVVSGRRLKLVEK